MAPALELVVEQPLDLGASLESGQSHRWRREGDWYFGVVRENLIQVRQTGDGVEFHSRPRPEAEVAPLLQSYLRLDDDIRAIYADIGRDPRVAEMIERYPGLRLLRIDPWECLVSFICSANSNIPRIHQVVERMSEAYGHPIEMGGHTRHTFPAPSSGLPGPVRRNSGGWAWASAPPMSTRPPARSPQERWTSRNW